MFGLSGFSMVQCNMSVYCYSKSARNDTLEEIIYCKSYNISLLNARKIWVYDKSIYARATILKHAIKRFVCTESICLSWENLMYDTNNGNGLYDYI